MKSQSEPKLTLIDESEYGDGPTNLARTIDEYQTAGFCESVQLIPFGNVWHVGIDETLTIGFIAPLLDGRFVAIYGSSSIALFRQSQEEAFTALVELSKTYPEAIIPSLVNKGVRID